MGNPLSKCCKDTTIPKRNGSTTTTTTTTITRKVSSSSSGNGVPTITSTSSSTANGGSVTDLSNAQPVASYVPPKDSPAQKSKTSSGPGFFKRASVTISSFTNQLGRSKGISIEQGLKDFPVPLSENERKVLLANELPSSSITRLTIGVDGGGMGIIHVAEWNGIKVAIKEASVHVISKEVEIYSRMKGCSGVVPFYGVTYPRGLDKLCIVTKYANNGSLTWHLKVSYQDLTWDDKLRLATQIATAISQLHKEQVYHRDLHGGNILIDDQGNAMLTDFGASTVMEERVARNMNEYNIEPQVVAEGQTKFISKPIPNMSSVQKSSPAVKGANINNSGKADEDKVDPLIGVMAYIAPERFRNPRYFDAKCDIYSLGVLMWELTTGHSAFAREPQDVHLAVAIMNGKRERSVDGTPAEYKALYEKCWETLPEDRPNLDQILATLAHIKSTMSPEELAVKRERNLTPIEPGVQYEESVSIQRPTSDFHQHFLSEEVEEDL